MKSRTPFPMLFLILMVFVGIAFAGDLRVEYDEGVGFDSKDYVDRIASVKPNKVTASSTLDDNPSYRPQNDADGNAKTAWCEGAAGTGKGEWIRYDFAAPVQVVGFALTPKYAKDKATMFNNGRVKRLRIELEGGFSRTAEFKDDDERVAFGAAQLDYSLPMIDFKADPTLKKPVKSTWVRLTIEEVFPGKKFQDTCISEIDVKRWK